MSWVKKRAKCLGAEKPGSKEINLLSLESRDQKQAVQPGQKFIVQTGRYQVAYGGIATVTVNGPHSDESGAFVEVELGKALQLKLSIPLDEYCRRGSIRDQFLPRFEFEPQTNYFYVLVRPVEATHRPRSIYTYAAIGPWVTQDLSFIGSQNCGLR